jgi:hypothetical protein
LFTQIISWKSENIIISMKQLLAKHLNTLKKEV